MGEGKHTGKIIGLFALMFMSTYGQSIETLLQTGMDYDAAGSYGFWLSTGSICLVSLVMMVVPFVARLTNKEKLPYEQGKKLCRWNSIILFAVSLILSAITEFALVGGVGALVFYYINKWIFVSTYREPIGSSFSCAPQFSNIPNKPIQSTHICLSEENTPQSKYGTYNVHSSDILQQRIESNTQQQTQPEKEHPTVSDYSEESRPKGMTLKVLVNTVVLVILLASLIANIVLIIKNTELKKTVANLTEVNEQYYSYWEDFVEEIEFYDEYVVFVEDDNTNFYHKYDCYLFTGNYFWAYNIEAAITEGYVACPHCCY